MTDLGFNYSWLIWKRLKNINICHVQDFFHFNEWPSLTYKLYIWNPGGFFCAFFTLYSQMSPNLSAWITVFITFLQWHVWHDDALAPASCNTVTYWGGVCTGFTLSTGKWNPLTLYYFFKLINIIMMTKSQHFLHWISIQLEGKKQTMQGDLIF